MYRFLLKPRWIVFTVVMTLLVVVMVNLSLWQFRRLSERKDFNAEVRQRTEQPVAPIADVLAAHPDDAEWRTVSVTGTYEAAGQVLIRDRSLEAIPGFNVVTPLRLPDGRFLVVQRGFLPVGDAVPAPPAGPRTVVGRLRDTQVKRHSWEKADPAEGVLDKLNRVDVARLDQQVDGDSVAPLYLELTGSDADFTDLAQIPLPELSDGPHLSYAVQWILFSLAAITGWVLTVRKAVNDRAKAAAKAAKAALAGASTELSEAAPTPPSA